MRIEEAATWFDEAEAEVWQALTRLVVSEVLLELVISIGSMVTAMARGRYASTSKGKALTARKVTPRIIMVVLVPDDIIIIAMILGAAATADHNYSAEPFVTRDGVGVEAHSSLVGALATFATEDDVACLKDGVVVSRGPDAAVAALANCMGCGISSLTFY